MTAKKGKALLSDFISECEKDNDPYFIVHFSRTEDCFKGYHEGMDLFDASIVVSEMIKHFGRDLLSIANIQYAKNDA